MKISYCDCGPIKETEIAVSLSGLESYRAKVRQIVTKADFNEPEGSLVTYSDTDRLTAIKAVTEKLKNAKQVIVVGIGGSDLGTRAIHNALSTSQRKQRERLYFLSVASPAEMSELLTALDGVTDPSDLAMFVVSKSGTTTETITNATVLLSKLVKQFGSDIYSRVVFIGNADNPLLVAGDKLGAHTLTMPTSVGGRYSVFTSVGLAPLSVLGYDTDRILSGVKALFRESEYEPMVAESATGLYQHLKRGVRNVKLFAFASGFEAIGQWWMQLTAESLGKTEDNDGRPVELGFIPSSATAVNLHSTEQLYFSGFKGVYTDFLTLPQSSAEVFAIPEEPPLAKSYIGQTIESVSSAIQAGVLTAYKDSQLPYRLTELGSDLEYELGLFMSAKMLETMYLAQLLNLNAFNQPNVELYKLKTKAILGI